MTPYQQPRSRPGFTDFLPRQVASTLRLLASAAGLLLVTVAGLTLAVQLFGKTGVEIGPFSATISLHPSTHGQTEVEIPPLGSLLLDSHLGPSELQIRLDSLDRTRTEALITDPTAITRASATVVDDMRSGVIRLVLRTTAVAMLGAMLIAAIVYRRMSRVAWAGGLALTIMSASLGTAFATIRPESINVPRYEGLLANAPVVVGDARRIADRYDEYAAQLQRLVQNVGNLYNTVADLPIYAPDDGTIRVLHVSDLHLNPAAWSVVRTTVEQFHIDLVIDTGDITDWGTEPEAGYVASIALLDVPYVYVRGNHDSAQTQEAIAQQPNAVVLDNEVKQVAGLTLAGIGDPRFTPDKSVPPAGAHRSVQGAEQLVRNGQTLAETIGKREGPVDIALVHDPAAASPLVGAAPLVLAGHTHDRQVRVLRGGPDRSVTVAAEQQSTLMVQGSSGGAGLRGLEGDEPTPLAMSVLYLDPQHQLLAYDDIRVGGTGLAEVALSRHVVDQPPVRPDATVARD